MFSSCHRLLPHFLCLASLFAGLAGCSSTPDVKLPDVPHYRMDVQQGNVVTQGMIAKLKPGMNKSQVKFIMGTPLLTDVFHKDRWDYVYRYVEGGLVSSTLTEERRITLYFEGDLLKRVEGDVIAAGSTASPPDGQAPAGTETPSLDKPAYTLPPRKEEEKGFFDSILEKIGL